MLPADDYTKKRATGLRKTCRLFGRKVKEREKESLSEADGVITRVTGFLRCAVAGGEHVVEVALHDGLFHAGIIALGLLRHFLGKVSALLFSLGAGTLAAFQTGLLGIVANGLERIRGKVFFRYA